jgi:hypothetical protein
MKTPLTISQAKDKALFEIVGNNDPENYDQWILIINRAIELHTASHLKYERERIEQALPTIETLKKLVYDVHEKRETVHGIEYNLNFERLATEISNQITSILTVKP